MLRLSYSGSTFYQNGSLIAQYFYKTTLDLIKSQVIAFIFYYSLFVRLLNLPFPDGVIQTWLGWV